MIDFHVHTHHSDDSNVKMEEYCLEAIKKGVKYICFTDHVDNNPKDPGYKKFSPERYFEEFFSLKEKFKEDLKLFAGIEFSEPHIYRNEFENIKKYPFDYIIGSIHFFYKDMFLSEMVEKKIPIDIVYENYWSEIEKMVDYGGFSAIGHLDFPKRYFNKLIYDKKRLESILKKAIEKNLIIEINTSSLRKGFDQPMPGVDILMMYKKVGGKFITIGADAHRLNELGQDYDIASNLVEKDFVKVIFDKMDLKILEE